MALIFLNEYMKMEIKGKRNNGAGREQIVYDLGNGPLIYTKPIKVLNNRYYSAKKKNKKKKKFIGAGARRIVYDLGNGKVLKVAKSIYGIKSNRREVLTFKSSSPYLRKYLGKIINYDRNGYHWLTMKKYKRKIPHLKINKRKILRLRAIFRSYGIIPYEILTHKGKPNYANLRLKKYGKIVVIDYGNFRFRRKIR